MSSEIMQETTPLVECSAFHLGMSVLEASLRNTEDSDAIISGLLKGAAEFYGASRASVVEADWDLGIGVITYEWCKDGVSAQRDMLQCLPMEKFPRWRKALRANKPVVISDLQRLEKVYPDETAFFREHGVTTLLAAPFSKRINQGFIAVDDPTRYTDDPVFLFIASYGKRCGFSKRYFLVLVACRHLTCTKTECRKMFLSLIAPLTTIRLNRGKRSNRLPYIFAQGQER